MIACSLLSYGAVVWMELVPMQMIRSQNQFFEICVLSFVFCASVVSGNISLKYLPVSFNQVIGAEDREARFLDLDLQFPRVFALLNLKTQVCIRLQILRIMSNLEHGGRRGSKEKKSHSNKRPVEHLVRDENYLICPPVGDNGSGKGGGGFKLFGVNINLQEDLYNTSPESSSKRKRIRKDCNRDLCNRGRQHHGIARDDPGYHSDNSLHVHSGRPARVKKKAIPWTQSEHISFLIGLEKLGKGHWKGISKDYVPTKTPTQVASHAQKYYIRISGVEKKRASPFDNMFSVSNSPPRLSTAASFNASEGSQQAMTAAVNSSKKASRKRGLDGLSANIAANKKIPPVSATRANASDVCHISNKTGDPGQSFAAALVTQQTELRPMLTDKFPSYIYDSSRHAIFPAQVSDCQGTKGSNLRQKARTRCSSIY
ncbi:hypothetical protein ACET3Z_023946 [Daucus carota]